MDYIPPREVTESNERLQEQLAKMKAFRDKQIEKEAQKAPKKKAKSKKTTPTRQGQVYINKLKENALPDPNKETKERIKELTKNVNRKPVKNTITSLEPVKGMTKEERIELVFARTKLELDKNKDKLDGVPQHEIPQLKRPSYLSHDDNRIFNLELAKRTFATQTHYNEPQDLQLALAEYVALCDQHGKFPTITSACVYIGMPSKEFYEIASNPLSLFYDVISRFRDFCEALQSNGAIEGAINPNVFSTLAKKWYDGFDNDSNKNQTIILNNNNYSQDDRNRLLNALEISQSQLPPQITQDDQVSTTSEQEEKKSDAPAFLIFDEANQ